MILIDTQILSEIEKKSIVIEPFRKECLGTNSYDVHLGNVLAKYDNEILDVKKHNKISYFNIPEEGYVLQPHEFYLGVTEEYTETHRHVPFLEGKSSSGRVGISCHSTAGKGDVGFCNHWTLEITCAKPVRIYAGMPIAQLIYFETDYEQIKTLYGTKKNAKYTERNDKPVESMMYKNF